MQPTLPVTPEIMHLEADGFLRELDAAPPGPVGTLRVRVRKVDGDLERTVRFGATAVTDAAGAPADAELTIGAEDLLALATGAADGALLYLAGRLEVEGDEDLVLGLGTAVRVPGAARALIDPAALDPLAVSDAIAHVPTEHLSAVMSGGFRGLVLAEVFRRLPDFLIAEKAERVRVAVMFEVEGENPAAPDRYVVRVAGGACAVEADVPADTPVDATLVLAGHEFLRLVLGHLNPVRGVLSGQIRVRGEVLKALGFNAVMRIPGR